MVRAKELPYQQVKWAVPLEADAHTSHEYAHSWWVLKKADEILLEQWPVSAVYKQYTQNLKGIRNLCYITFEVPL